MDIKRFMTLVTAVIALGCSLTAPKPVVLASFQEVDALDVAFKDAPFLPASSTVLLNKVLEKSKAPAGTNASVFGSVLVRRGAFGLTEAESKELADLWESAFRGLSEDEQKAFTAIRTKIANKEQLSNDELEKLTLVTRNALLSLPAEKLNRLQEINQKALIFAVRVRWPELLEGN
jgi:hypothetical protein